MHTNSNVTVSNGTPQVQELHPQADAAITSPAPIGSGTVTAPALPSRPTLPVAMLNASRWLLWKYEENDKRPEKPLKMPYYQNGRRRTGAQNTPEDWEMLATWEQARTAFQAGDYEGFGFALGPDENGGHWQGIDLDGMPLNKLYETKAVLPGYTEISPSGNGCHAMGYGRSFANLPSNGSGFEAYSTSQFFTMTGNEGCGDLTDIADYVETRIAPVWNPAGRTVIASAGGVEIVTVDAKTITDIRSALNAIPCGKGTYSTWANMGQALRELGDIVGRELWMTWSRQGEGFDPAEASKKWNQLRGERTGYAAVFKRAQECGWTNPNCNAARGGQVTTERERNSRQPRDILRKITAPPYSFNDVPASIASLSAAFSKAAGFDPSGAIVAATVAAGAVIDDRYQLAVRPESNWYESARLWAVLIGPPSAGKSPTIRVATDHLKAMHGKLFSDWKIANDALEEKDKSPRPALYVSDTNIDAMSESLKGNERGLLMLTEEFSSWIGGIDCADRGQGARNRGGWLELYDGGQRQIERIQRGAFMVPNWGASVLAACTPDGLQKQMKSLPEDGLIQRFIPVIMSTPDFEARGDVRAAQHEWMKWLEYAYSRTACSCKQPVLFFSPDAAKLFEIEHLSQRKLTDATSESFAAFASHLGKHGGMLARLSLIFHIFSGDTNNTISAATMEMAIRFTYSIRKHASVMFNGILSSSPALELSRALARSIVADKSKMSTVSRDWMTQHCGEFRKAEDKLRREAVQVLEDAYWLETDPAARNYSGWPSKWEVHPKVFEMFAKEGEQWRARREAVREAIGENA